MFLMESFSQKWDTMNINESERHWMNEIRWSVESEDIDVLETPIHKSPINLESTADTIRKNLEALKTFSKCLSEEFSKLYRNLDYFIWNDQQNEIKNVCGMVHEMLSQCKQFFTKTPEEVFKLHQSIMYNHQILMKALNGHHLHDVSNLLTSLAESSALYVNAVRVGLIQPLIYSVKGSASELNIIVAVKTVHHLIQEDNACKKILLSEGVLPALFEVCIQYTPSLNFVKPTAFRAVSLYIDSEYGRKEIERVGSIWYITQILSSPVTSELLWADAAALLVQLSEGERMTDSLKMLLQQHMEVLLYSLTATIQKTKDPFVFLVGTSAMASLMVLESSAHKCLADCDAAYALVDGWKEGKVNSINSKDRIVAVLASMAQDERCTQEILRAGGIPVLVDLLNITTDSSNISLDLSFCNMKKSQSKLVIDRIQQRAAIGLGRLAKNRRCAKEIIKYNGQTKLKELSRLNSNRLVVIASLAALRRINQHEDKWKTYV